MTRPPIVLALFGILMTSGLLAQSDKDTPAALQPPSVQHLDVLARETMVVEHPSGTLFVAGHRGGKLGDPPLLWKSQDDGLSWARVDVGSAADDANGNADVDLAVGPHGTLYFVTMGIDVDTYKGTHIAVGVSEDVGTTWRWTTLSQKTLDDRPWVGVTPDGTAHVVWNDGQGVSHGVSTDRGSTWHERERIYPKGCSSHLAVGPAGELAVRITPDSASSHRYHEGVEFVAVSVDGGETWHIHDVPGERYWDPEWEYPDSSPRWVEPVAWDAAGALYLFWSEDRVLHTARSLDHGATWRAWDLGAEQGFAFFPYLVGGDEGRVLATWHAGEKRGPTSLHVGLVDFSDGAPQMRRLASFLPDSWSGQPKVQAAAGEYFPAVFLSDGDIGVVSTIQDAEEKRFGFEWRRLRME
ncbi:MAG: sialidase family protein [Pseudomonadota bacterium]